MWGSRARFKQKKKRKEWLHSWAENENGPAWWPNMARLGSSPRGLQLGRLARAAARGEGRLRFVRITGKRAGLGSWAESGPASLLPLLAQTTAGAAMARLPSTAMALRWLTGFSSLGGSSFLVLDGSGGGVDGGLGAKGILIRATMDSRRRDGDEVPWRLRSSVRRSPAGAHTRAAVQGQNGARPLGKKGCDGEGGSGRDKGDAGLGQGGVGLRRPW